MIDPRHLTRRHFLTTTSLAIGAAATRPASADDFPRYAAANANSGPDSPRDGGIIKNQSSPHAKLHSVDLQGVRWTGGFWADQFEKTATVTLPRLWELADPWAWHNMQVAAGLKEGEAKGCYWEDAWIYKWIESACYVYTQTRDPEAARTDGRDHRRHRQGPAAGRLPGHPGDAAGRPAFCS